MGTNPQVKAHAILDLKPRGHQLQIEPTRYSIRETHFARHCKPPAYSSRWCARTPPQTACSSRQPPFHPRLTPPLRKDRTKKRRNPPGPTGLSPARPAHCHEPKGRVGVQWQGLYQTEPQPTSMGGGCCPVCAQLGCPRRNPSAYSLPAYLPAGDSLVALRGVRLTGLGTDKMCVRRVGMGREKKRG